MAWEARGANRYYYRKHWAGGRCVSEYLGGSATAVLHADADARERQAAAAVRQAEQDRRQAATAGSQAVQEIGAAARGAAAARSG